MNNLQPVLENELSKDTIIWIKEIIRRIEAHEVVDYKQVRASLINKISLNFDPYEVKSKYIIPPCSVTLLGINKYGDGDKWTRIVDQVIRHIKNLLIGNTKIEEISSKEIAEQLQLHIRDVEATLHFTRELGSFWNSSSGGDYKCERIRFSSNECFNEYMQYESIADLLVRFERRFVENKVNSNLGHRRKAKSMRQNNRLFIIMPMANKNPAFIDVLDSIKDVANKLGIEAFRIDEDISNERITDRILKSIETADHIVADLTDSRPNVFFEAGFALGIGKIPVFIAGHDTKLEFDVKDYPVIFFKNQRELKDKLSTRLKELVQNSAATNKFVTNNNNEETQYDENDIKTILTGWAQKKVDGKDMLGTLHFEVVDNQLGLMPGSAKKYLKDIITTRWNYVVDNEGANTIKFKYGPTTVVSRSPRILSHGIDLDKF